jgi:hypothetical protein
MELMKARKSRYNVTAEIPAVGQNPRNVDS